MVTAYNKVNLAMTVHATGKYRNRLKCTVPREKKWWYYLSASDLSDDPEERKRQTMTDYHEWKDGRCVHCKKTLKEVFPPKVKKARKPPKESSKPKAQKETIKNLHMYKIHYSGRT